MSDRGNIPSTIAGMEVIIDDNVPAGSGPWPVSDVEEISAEDMVNHPRHYTRGPTVTCPECNHSWVLECINVVRYIRDFRLATAVKYLWRVAFGGKFDDSEDVSKAIWYETDYLEHPIGTDQG